MLQWIGSASLERCPKHRHPDTRGQRSEAQREEVRSTDQGRDSWGQMNNRTAGMSGFSSLRDAQPSPPVAMPGS